MSHRITRSLSAALLAVGLSAGTLAAQASALASFESSLGQPFCERNGFGPPSGTATSVVSSVSYTGPDCTLSSSGYAYLGVVGARAQVDFSTGIFTFFAAAESRGAWSDNITATIPGRFSVEGLSSFRLYYNIGATGSVSGTDAGPSGTAFADIRYDYSVGSSSFRGTQSSSGAITGQWGTIAGYVDLMASYLGAGNYAVSSFGLALSGEARAAASNGPGRVHLIADANFGSTLEWMGATRVEGFDAQGNRIELPSDFRLQLTGQQTGFDYWNAARPTSVVPEPATLWLMAAGMLAVGVIARRRVTAAR